MKEKEKKKARASTRREQCRVGNESGKAEKQSRLEGKEKSRPRRHFFHFSEMVIDSVGQGRKKGTYPVTTTLEKPWNFEGCVGTVGYMEMEVPVL